MKKLFAFLAILASQFSFFRFRLHRKEKEKEKLIRKNQQQANEITVLKTEAKAKELNDEIIDRVTHQPRDPRLQQFDRRKPRQ